MILVFVGISRQDNESLNTKKKDAQRLVMKDLRWKSLLLSGGMLAVGAVSAQEQQTVECQPDAPPAIGSYPFPEQAAIEYQVPPGLEIGDVRITSLKIFDEANPRENNALYRWANRFHIETREERISQQLLFEAGEAYDPRVIDESARLLRDEKYLNDADIRPVSVCDGKVDVEVITRDIWSFTPELSFSRSGGENEYRFGIRETNLLGTGVELAVRTKHDIDRDSTEFVYKDRNLRGSRIESRLVYSDNDDGSEKLASLLLPFYALDTRRSWQVNFEEIDRTDSQYFRGDEVTEVHRESKDYLVRYGWSRGLVDGVAGRWVLGYRFEEEIFSPGDELPPPAVFPVDKTLSYPFLEYSAIEDDYDTGVNLNELHRTEDIHLGYKLAARIGYASEALGSDVDRLVLSGSFSDTLIFNQDIWLAHELSWSGLYNMDTKSPEDVVVDYQLRYLKEQTKHRSFFSSFQATWSKNLNSNLALYYGGETGARAFDNRFQGGDRRVALTLEERMYTPIHLFNLIRVGWAIFLDVGKAWDPDVDDGIEDDYLASAGFGLRLSSSKSDKGRMMHLDLAFPLTNKDDPAVSSSEVAIRLKSRF